MTWPTDGEYEFNLEQDWKSFRDEVQALVRKGMNMRQIIQETGGDADDVFRAMRAESE